MDGALSATVSVALLAVFLGAVFLGEVFLGAVFLGEVFLGAAAGPRRGVAFALARVAVVDAALVGAFAPAAFGRGFAFGEAESFGAVPLR